MICQKQTASWLRASDGNVSKGNSTDSFGNNPLTRNERTGSVTPSRKTAAGPALPPVPFPMASSPSTKKASGLPSTEARIVPDLGSGDHDNCIRPFFVSVLHVATSRYKPGTPSFLAAAISRRTDAVTSCAPPDTVQSLEPADAITSEAISPCLVACSGMGNPEAPNAPPRSLLTSIAAKLGSTVPASKCCNESPPFFAASVWHTAQYFPTNAFCSAKGIRSAPFKAAGPLKHAKTKTKPNLRVDFNGYSPKLRDAPSYQNKCLRGLPRLATHSSKERLGLTHDAKIDTQAPGFVQWVAANPARSGRKQR